MKKITYLITGGAGNIGSALASRLAQEKCNNIIVVDNLSTGKIEKFPEKENITFIKANTNNYNDIVPIFGRYNFDFVFHYAAVVGVKRTLKNPMMVLEDIEGIKKYCYYPRIRVLKEFFILVLLKCMENLLKFLKMKKQLH